jgi:2-polyprenyl-3-methyl-5-hydroxy-6-metoxy-1,4-benzoquinol methylase
MLIGRQSLSTYIITNDLSIQLVEIPEPENSPECDFCGKGYHWNKAWPASLALSRYLVEGFHREKLKGCPALVIGCGMGLEGLVLAKLGASVTFLDHVQDVLHVVSQNCLLNEIESLPTICCCWQDSNNVQTIGKYDLIIASDILFYSDQWIWIKSLLETTLKIKGLALFSDQIRYPDIMDFFHDLTKADFRVMWTDPGWAFSKDQNILICCVERL